MDELTLSKQAADDCAAACQTYIDGLNDVLVGTKNATDVAAFGTLPSGLALGQKFHDVAAGQPYSLDTILRQHIDVILRLQAAFKAAGQGYLETDEQNSGTLAGQRPKG